VTVGHRVWHWAHALAVFAVGVVLIVDTVVSQFHLLELVAGLILVALVNVDALMERWYSHCHPYDRPEP